MLEEKKEEKPAEAKAAAEASAQTASQAQAAPAATPAPGAEKKEALAVKKEKPSNCASCNKSIKNKRWYYRNGKFYCTKTCWQEASKKEAKKEASQEVPKK